MNNLNDEFGRNAGKIWDALNSNGAPLSQSRLQKRTNLTDEAFHGAIGWLARENKVNKTGIMYRLGETNLTSTIGTNAGKIWSLLASQNEADISTIKRQTKINEQDAHAAIGWLARENKIDGQIGKNNQLRFQLKKIY